MYLSYNRILLYDFEHANCMNRVLVLTMYIIIYYAYIIFEFIVLCMERHGVRRDPLRGACIAFIVGTCTSVYADIIIGVVS